MRQRPSPVPGVPPQLAPPKILPKKKPGGQVLTRETRQQYVDVAVQAAQKYGIPPRVVVAQVQQESGFNPTARGKAGEIGIAQIIPRYHPGVNPHDPVQSLDYLARFLRVTADQMAQRYGPDMALVAAVAAWNAGTPTIASGVVPPTTVNYIASIFGPETAREFVARAQGKPPSLFYAGVPPSVPPNLPPGAVLQAVEPFMQGKDLQLSALGLLLARELLAVTAPHASKAGASRGRTPSIAAPMPDLVYQQGQLVSSPSSSGVPNFK